MGEVGPPEFESESLAPKAKRIGQATLRAQILERGKEKTVFISNEKLVEYLNVRELESLTHRWLNIIRLCLLAYLEFCNYKVSKAKTIDYLKLIQEKHAQSYYRKQAFQIRRFLQYLDLDYMDKVKIVSEPDYEPRRITPEDINETLAYFEGDIQLRTVILLGSVTGLRPSEIYKLVIDNIDLQGRKIRLNGSKNGKKRVVFITPKAKKALRSYIKHFKGNKQLHHLFGQFRVQRAFKHAPISVKHLRKYFAQTWIRNEGNYIALEQLLGHSIRSNVTMQHYALFSEGELQGIYDKVMKKAVNNC